MPVKFAYRFESANRAVIAPMSQISSSVNPCDRIAARSASLTVADSVATLSA